MTETEARVMINTVKVREVMGGISEVSLWRLVRDPAYAHLGFPQPMKLNRINYWFEDDIRAVQNRLASASHQAGEKRANPPRAKRKA